MMSRGADLSCCSGKFPRKSRRITAHCINAAWRRGAVSGGAGSVNISDRYQDTMPGLSGCERGDFYGA